ncbi:hypothetical protein [Mastigocoleus sp. MO_188.B34]|uniref:hypothetical protein n=1 Tax=Mastigocoleus sp. MO_188.B34 TaxID=3036635 RepID=UPI0026326CBD|nr:hypothetical protein [Mastigocoleus sp. MO_188.B34]
MIIAASGGVIAISGFDFTWFSRHMEAMRMLVPNISWIPLNPPWKGGILTFPAF